MRRKWGRQKRREAKKEGPIVKGKKEKQTEREREMERDRDREREREREKKRINCFQNQRKVCWKIVFSIICFFEISFYYFIHRNWGEKIGKKLKKSQFKIKKNGKKKENYWNEWNIGKEEMKERKIKDTKQWRFLMNEFKSLL